MPSHEIVASIIALIACSFDLHGRRIPNRLTLGAALAAVASSCLTSGFPGAGSSVGGWATGVLLWLPFYALGGMGAGDVKLLAAIGAWLGPAGLVQVSAVAAIAGAALALVVAIVRRCASDTFRNVSLLLMHWRVNGLSPYSELTLETSKGPRLPYALPIFAGTMVTLWLR